LDQKGTFGALLYIIFLSREWSSLRANLSGRLSSAEDVRNRTLDDAVGVIPDQPKMEKARPRESAAERAARREGTRVTVKVVATKIRMRAARQRIQAVSCVALIAVLLVGGGVFFYYAQTIALNELKAQSEFVSKRRAEIDAETNRVKQDKSI
jgi:hypothetical protein